MRRLVLLAVVASLAVPATANAAFPGGNGRIAFDRKVGKSSRVFTMRADGSGVRMLPCSEQSATGRCSDAEPAWSRSGHLLAVANRSGLAILRADGRFVRQVVADGDAESDEPAWAPDGKRLVFTRTFPGESSSIWVVRTNGRGAKMIIDDAFGPVWSIRNRILIGGIGLASVNPGGFAPQPLLGRDVYSQDWSPRGTRVVYVRSKRLYTVRANGAERRALSGRHRRRIDAPLWSPNGRSVAYVRLRGGHGTLLLRNLRTGRVRAIGGRVRNPNWQAR